MATPPNVQAYLDQINASGRDFAARNPTAPAENRVTWYYDEGRGALYHVDGNGKKVYENVPGVASPSKPDGGGLVHGNAEWNQGTGQWDVPIDWGKVGSWGVGAGLGLGALNAAGVIGGGAGAGAGAMYGPPESLAAGAGGGAGAAAGAGGVGASLLKNLTSVKGIASLAGLIPLLMSAKGGGGTGSGGGAGDFAQMPQLNSLMDMSVDRAQRTDPLHQAVTQLAMSRLPTNVQR